MLNIFRKKHNILNIIGKLYGISVGKWLLHFENSKIQNKSSRHNPIFIIGVPRTGSTIFYQIITNKFEVAYIDNLAHVFSRNLYFSLIISKFFYSRKPHNNFVSKKGSTLKGGLHAPSECGLLWNWYFDKSGSQFKDKLNEKEVIHYFRNRIIAIMQLFDTPFVIKNLFNSVRLNFILKTFPNAKIINVKRNPYDTVKSILNARTDEAISSKEMWSVMPENKIEILSNSVDEKELVVKQVYYLEKEIKTMLELFSIKNVLEIQYESLINNMDEEINKTAEFIKCDFRKNEGDNPIIKSKMKEKEIDTEVMEYLQQYDWDGYTT